MNDKEKQLRYLAQSIRLKEASSPRLVRATMTVTSLSVLAFIVWAAFTDVHEIAHTPGEIVPSGFPQVVQHLEGGIVREIAIHDGDSVEQGQILMRLDGGGAEEDLKRVADKALTLSMQEERLRADIEKRAPKFSEEAMKRPDLIKDAEALFASNAEAKKKEADIVRDQIAQKQQAIAALQSDLDTAQRNFQITQTLYSRRQELQKQGLVPEIKMLETEQAYNQLKGQVRNLNSQIAAAKSGISEYENRLAALTADNVDSARRELDGVIAARAENAEVLKKLQSRVTRLDVRAPVRGAVKGLSVNTVGSVIQPGQMLMEIIPADAPLVAALKIPPRYIGHMKAGQDVMVKFSSFDFSRYGSVKGKLDMISASTFTAENGERYYQGRVSMAQNHVGADPNNLVLPGMTVMADVITGDKTVLQYLLKPIRNALSSAFTER